MIDHEGMAEAIRLRDLLPIDIFGGVLRPKGFAWDLDAIVRIEKHNRARLQRVPRALEVAPSRMDVILEELLIIGCPRDQLPCPRVLDRAIDARRQETLKTVIELWVILSPANGFMEISSELTV